MARLKIALLSRWYWEETRRFPMGGMVRQLAEALAAAGHDITVLSQSPNARGLEKTRIGPLDVWLTPRERKRDLITGLRDKWAKQTYRHRKVHTDALALRDFLKKCGPFDVLWAQCEEPDGLVAAVAMERGIKVPPILTQIHSLRYRFDSGKFRFTEQEALRLSFRRAKRIIANSILVAGDTCRAYAGPRLPAKKLEEKIHVVHPNLQREFLQARHPFSPPPEQPRILFFGAINEKKGILDFLQALPHSQAAMHGTPIGILGGFTENNAHFNLRWEKALRALRDHLQPDQLILLGQLPSEAVMREIQRSSVVVLPSYYDEFSRALVETLILGRPVITTERVGAASIVRDHDCGLVVPVHAPAALGHAIDEILAPGSLHHANAQRIAPQLLTAYSPEAIAAQLLPHLIATAYS